MQVGIKGYSELVVTPELLADKVGSGRVAVYATPMMIAAMEQTAATSIMKMLEHGFTTVGIHIDVSHVSATPLGMKVHIETELVDIAPNGKILKFKVEAYDELGLIGSGSHQRAIINKAKFESHAQAKIGCTKRNSD